MWSGFWFHTSMQSSKYRCIPYNLGLKIVNNKTIWYVTTLFSSHLFTGKLTKTSSCLPTKWRRRHRACILLCYHYWTQKHWPITEKQWRWKQTKLNYYSVNTKSKLYGAIPWLVFTRIHCPISDREFSNFRAIYFMKSAFIDY